MLMNKVIPVYYRGVSCGEASLQQEGLYCNICLKAAMVTREVIRAYFDDGEKCLGVLIPENGKLCLCRRVPMSQLKGLRLEEITIGTRETEWAPWSGTVFDCDVTDAISKLDGKKRIIAMPFSTEEEFPHIQLFSICTPITVHNRQYLALTVEE